jgi:NAD(P)-dependent dehydrogenase (short-subunit alcohol dehydrogenase family)
MDMRGLSKRTVKLWSPEPGRKPDGFRSTGMKLMYRAKLSDGVAWVTGASSGIGRAVALELARRGWRIALTARRVAELESLAAEVAAMGGAAFVYPGDVTDRVAMAALVAGVEADHGPVALALLNAGGNFPSPRGEFVGENFRRTVALNADGVLNCLEPLLPLMSARRAGQVAVVASVAAYGGLPTAASYCMAKAGVRAMCEALKFDLDRVGVTMQIVCPGYVRTPLTDSQKQPKPFMIEADDAARRICDGLARGGFEIAFPRPMVWIVKTLRALPYSLFFRLMARGSRRYA